MNPVPATPEKATSAPKAAPSAVKVPSPKKEAKKPVAKKSAAKKTVSKKTSKDGVNKSEEIRKIATAMKAKNEKPRPVKIIAILKSQGIEVSSPQVSMVLKKMGFRPRSRKSGAAGGAATTVVKKASKSVLSIDDLINAKKAVAAFGGNAAKLVDAVSALVELQ